MSAAPWKRRGTLSISTATCAASAMQSIYAIDAMPLLYRGYFAFLNKPRRTAAGVNTSPLFVFANTLLQIREQCAPSHWVLAFDSQTPTFRHKEYPSYKAQRDKLPEDIAAAIPMAQEFAAAMRIPSLRIDGFEADDILGTVSSLAVNAGLSAFLVTPDKDIAQLVGEGVSLYRLTPGGAPEVLGPPEVCAHWGISSPSQMIDYLALAGDASDNIPGIPGVGEKTAQKLLAEYGTLEGILAAAAAGKIAGKLCEKLTAGVEHARMSRFLTEIRRDIPLPLTLDDMRVQEPDCDALAAICTRFELASIAKRLGVDVANATLNKKPADGGKPPEAGVLPLWQEAPAEEATRLHAPKVHTVQDAASLAALTETLSRASLFAVAVETTSNDPREASLTGLSFAVTEDDVWQVALPDSTDLFGNLLDDGRRAALTAVLASPTVKVAHDSKFVREVLERNGMPLSGLCHDTMLMHFALDSAARHGLDSALDGATNGALSRTAGLAGAPAATKILALYNVLTPKIDAAGLRRAVYECEEPLVEVLLDIERQGVKIDAAALRDFGRELAGKIAALEEKIQSAAGGAFNIASPKQLGEVLFARLAIDPKAKRTSTGAFATGEEVLQKYAREHQIVRDILDWRAAEKLRSTYADKLPSFIGRDGRVHTRLFQCFTETGRLSSSDPNLQNIPVRTEMGKRIRAAVVARDDSHALVSADYSQIELRIMAALSGDEAMLAAFQNGRDIHTETAARVFGVAPGDVTPLQRSQCKAINFGIIYGMSAFGLAQRLEIPRQEAAGFIEEYFRHYPGVKAYMERAIAQAREKGFAETILGRRRSLPEINSRSVVVRQAAERNAVNTPVQGSAADLIKLAMVKVWRALTASGLHSRIILQIHDELLLDAPLGEVEEVKALLEREMATAFDFGVPLVVETGSGRTWLEAH